MILGRCLLSPSPLQYIGRVTFDTLGNIIILDSSQKTVYAFDGKGMYLGPIGSKGRGPGHYLYPMALSPTRDGLAVADFADHRVNIFRPDRSLKGSFTYSSQSFSATSVSYYAITDTYYLFGNRWRTIGGMASADLVNMYNGNGQFITSTFAFPQKWLRFNLMPMDSAIVAKDAAETSYFALPFESILHTISPQDQAVTDKDLQLPGYSSPHTPLPPSLEDLTNVHTWELEYTPIRAMLLHSGRVFIQYETDHNLRYTIAVVDLTSGKTIRTVQTNYLITSANTNGTALFTNNPGSRIEGHRELYSGAFK